MRPSPPPPRRQVQRRSLYRAGWSLARIGDNYGTTDMTVRRALAKHGVDIRPRRGFAKGALRSQAW